MSYSHLRADCMYAGISSGLNTRKRIWAAFTYLPNGGVRDEDVSVGLWRGPEERTVTGPVLALESRRPYE